MNSMRQFSRGFRHGPPRDAGRCGIGTIRLGQAPASRRRNACAMWSALATAAAFAVPVGELIATTRRSAYVAFARQSAMYLAHVTFGLNYTRGRPAPSDAIAPPPRTPAS